MTKTSPPARKNWLVPDLERWPVTGDKPLIELADVSIAFQGLEVLKGLNLQILPGKTTVIVGRSGSGKSVLLKLMMGILRPDSGKVILFGHDIDSLSEPEMVTLRKRMSMLFQNYALLDSLTVEQNVAFSLLENTRMRRKDALKLAHDLLNLLGLAGSERQMPSDLSGGMKKRVSLARALVANPEVVLFDEPTTGLDPINIEKVDEMLVMARKQYQITSVVISHDMASTQRLADLVAFLHDGRIVEIGTYDQFTHSAHPKVRAFLDGAQTSRLQRVEGGETSGHDGATRKMPVDEPIIELVGVHKTFGENVVLKGVDLQIFPKKITVLIGGSGSGKSVIVKHIMGLFKADAGEVLVFGRDITPMSNMQLLDVRRRFGMLFQHAALLDSLSVYDNVAFPLVERTKTPRKEVKRRVGEILERLHITEIMHRNPGQISEGQKKRVGLARAIIMKPEVMIYDEPTTGQDPIRTRQVDDMIVEAQNEFDITSIVISHDMASTFRVAHRIALLHLGQICAYGTPEEVKASTNEHVQHFIYAGAVEVD